FVQGRETPAGRKRQKIEADVLKLVAGGVEPCAPSITNSLGMTFVLVPPGTFVMGSPANERDRDADESQHEVEITRPFYIGIHPVTQGQFEEITGDNPCWFRAGGSGASRIAGLDTARFPAEQILFAETGTFCKRLSARSAEKKAKRKYRLPTEAEWEYASRAAGLITTPFSIGNGKSLSGSIACFNTGSPYGRGAAVDWIERTVPVGNFRPNPLGIYDMHGTIWEWTADWYDSGYFANSPRRDPTGPKRKRGTNRTVRGGAWISAGGCCRSAERFGETLRE